MSRELEPILDGNLFAAEAELRSSAENKKQKARKKRRQAKSAQRRNRK